jgi:hypothetical protein
VGDGGVTTKMPSWYSPSVAARTAATPLSDWRSVARSARTGRRTASRGATGLGGAHSHGEGASRAEGLRRRAGRGRRGAAGTGRRRAARDVAACWSPTLNCVAGTVFKLEFLQNFD